MRAALPAGLFFALALAGCLGGSDGEQMSEREQEVQDILPPNYEEAPPAAHEANPNFGSIVGHVVNDEYLPLKNALVGFIDPYLAAVTDETGYFEIGLYAVKGFPVFPKVAANSPSI